MSSKYWYISYLASGFDHCNGTRGAYGNGVIAESPAEWAMELEDSINGPYIVLYAEEITEKLYDKFIEEEQET